MNNSVDGLIKINYIESVNRYFSETKERRLSDEALKCKHEYDLALSKLPDIPHEPWETIRLDVIFYLKRSFWRRDLDNCQKLFQDSLAKRYKFNDNRIVELHTYKKYIPNSSSESIYFKLTNKKLDKNLIKKIY